MTALAPLPRVSRIADNFIVHRQRDGGKALRLECGAANLTDVLREAEAQCQAKDTLFILHTDGLTGDKVLYAYAVKASAKVYSFRESYDGGRPVRVPKPEAKPLFNLQMTHFSPVEPWRWSPGADVLGVDRQTVEAR